MRIMAIDYGDAHTGIAISDPTGLLAGFTTVINSRRQEVVVEQVTLLAKEHGAEELVLGHPVNMDGTLGPRSEKAKAMKVLDMIQDAYADAKLNEILLPDVCKSVNESQGRKDNTLIAKAIRKESMKKMIFQMPEDSEVVV